jgi:hypothetical protein
MSLSRRSPLHPASWGSSTSARRRKPLRCACPGDSGMPLALSGMVYNTRGAVVPEAKVEIWQTDNSGHYDVEGYPYRGARTRAERRLHHPVGHAGTLPDTRMPTPELPHYSAGAQDADHTVILRHRSGIRRQLRQELHSRSAHHQPRVGASGAPLSCATVVGGKLWICSADGKTLTLSQYE